ncbi:MAG TPA: hypothetical protein EYP62_05200, partial [Kiritimatiellae bacterium]|nr:hypothetical protein [Kiritimatiellia bacterium]
MATFTIGVMYCIAYHVVSSYEYLAATIQDDSFYYFLPAWNFRRHGFFTFDGISPTYGFHPLWELFLTGLATLAMSREQLLRIGLACGGLFYLVAGIVVYPTVRRLSRPAWTAATGIAFVWLVNLPLMLRFSQGKENALHMLLLAAGLRLLESDLPRRKPAGAVTMGFLLGCLSLARINALLFAALVFSWYLIQILRRRMSWGLFSLLIAGFVVPTVAWGIYAGLHLGGIMPGSGALKVSRWFLNGSAPEMSLLEWLRGIHVFLRDPFVSINPQWPRILRHVAYLPGLILVSVGALVLLLRWPRSAPSNPHGRRGGTAIALLLLAGYAAGNFAATKIVLADYFEYGTWYHVPEYLFSLVLGGVG